MYESDAPEIIKYLTEDNLKLMYGRLNRRFVVVDALPAAETLSLANKNAIYVVKESIGGVYRYWPYVLENDEWKMLGIGRQELDNKIDKVSAIDGHLVVANDDGSLVDANIMPGTFVALSFDPTEQIQPHATDIRKVWNAFQTGMPVILLDNRSGGTGLYASLNAAGYTWPDGSHMAERLVDVDENYRPRNDTIPGYYDSDTKKFYDDIYHSIEIDPIEDALFHDLADDKVYLYDEGEFVRVLRFVQFSTNELMKDDPAWPSRKSARPVFFRIFEPMASATANNFYVVYGEYTTTIRVNVDPEIMYGNGVEEPLGVYEYNGETAGLVPDAPDSGADEKFLRADGQWEPIAIPEQVQSDWAQTDDAAPDFIKNKVTNFRGASANDDGAAGLVPAPTIIDKDRYLKGDGTWGTITIPTVADMTGATAQADGVHGLVPQPLIADREKFLKGDGTWETIAIPEQVQSDWAQTDDAAPDFIKNKVTNFRGASANDDGTSGLVPAPTITDKDRYLKGDGTWEPIAIPEQVQSDWTQTDDAAPDYIKNKVSNFRGASANDDGTSGLVPAPAIADKDRYLKGDGTWGTITIPEQVQSDWTQTDDTAPDFIKNKVTNFRGATANDDGISGLVPAPAIADKDRYLKGDGTWATITIPAVADMTGATAQADGVHGLVPQPLIADREKFLKGDGTWANVDNTRACTVAEMDAWLDAVDNEGNDNG